MELQDKDPFCKCNKGSRGSKCEHRIDVCSSSPCTVNGECIDDGLNFYCMCKKNWEGMFCEKGEIVR